MKETSTGRLLRIIQRAASAKHTHATWQAWAKAFDVEAHVNAERLHLLIPAFVELERQVELARDRGHQSRLKYSARVDGPLDAIKAALSGCLVNLQNAWANNVGYFTAQVVPLEYLEALDHHVDADVLTEESIAEIVGAIAGLKKILEDPGLTPAARQFVEQQIQAMISLLVMYGVGGGRAFSDAFIRSVARLVDTYRDAEADLTPETVKAVWDGWEVVKKAATGLKVFNSAISFMQNVQKMIEKGPGMFETAKKLIGLDPS